MPSGEAATLAATAAATAPRRRNYARRYAWFIVPAAVVVVAVILFPWAFTLYVSAHDWRLGGERRWVGLANYAALFGDARFSWAVLRTLLYTALAVAFPIVLGLAAALAFHRRFPLRGLARAVFILPMMATPVAVALVWTMMFHPQLGVLNWLLTTAGLPPSMWVYSASTVIPTLVMVEVWHWTPLVMLLLLGGLAADRRADARALALAHLVVIAGELPTRRRPPLAQCRLPRSRGRHLFDQLRVPALHPLGVLGESG